MDFPKENAKPISEKKCPYCFTVIDARASVCPSCKKKIGRAGKDGVAQKYHGIGSLLGVIVTALFFLGIIGAIIGNTKNTKTETSKTSQSAELSMTDGCVLQGKGGKCLSIRGDIDQDTVVRAISLADQSDIKGFVLNSGGGDVEAAMDLGRYFRRKEASVEVHPTGTCASACLFLLAGGVRRYLFVNETEYSARIGVHRTFTTRESSSTSESDRDFRRQNDLIKKYLREMNIPESLLDLMNSVSPASVKWLTESEADLYFPSSDPVWLDKRYSSRAADLGISKVELIRRLQRASQECNKFEIAAKDLSDKDLSDLNQLSIEDIKCREDILNGTR